MSPAVIERPRLRQRYDTEIRPRSHEELGLANVMEVPRLEKIVINMGVGRATQQQSLLEGAVRDLAGDRRPAARRHQGPPLDRGVQAS